MLVAAVVWLATGCKGKASNAQAEQVDGLYAVQTYSKQVEARQQGQRAKQVRLFEIPAPLKDRPEQILHRRGYTT